MNLFNPATLLLCLSLLYLLCATLVPLLQGRSRNSGAYDRWLGANLAAAAMYALALAAPRLPWLAVALGSCLLLQAKGSLLLASFARLLERPQPWLAGRPVNAAIALAIGGVLWLLPTASKQWLVLPLLLAITFNGALAALLMAERQPQGNALRLGGGFTAGLASYLLFFLFELLLGGGNSQFVRPGLLLPALCSALVLTLCFVFISKDKELAALRTLATLDPLTGVFNRRSFEELARRLCSHHARQQRPLSLLVIDLDHFKRINDNYGHSRGDMALRAMADTMALHTRTADIFGRFGGEEFCLLLPETDIEGAREVAGKVRAQINTVLVDPDQPDSLLSASIGVASLVPNNAQDWQQLFETADARLFRAKSSGRNKLIWYG